MVIEYLQLKNFANIYTSFKSECITIDFSKRKNKITLITGPNGSGKTSILSTLHPFANNGNLDVRNEMPLIRKGKEGYKEIHISNDGDMYIIKHFYTPTKESHSVKSYIEKNGVELNVNGNVTSFKSIVNEELEIEMDYLKLIRLGNNVTNFIDLKSTERKAFMGQIISEVEVYLKYFKKVTGKMRETKSVVSHLIDKIDKLGISDESELKKVQKHLSKELVSYKESIDKYNEELSIINYQIEKYESPLVIKESIDSTTKELKKMERLISKHADNILSTDEYRKMISTLEKDIVKDKVSLESSNEKLSSLLDSIDNLLQELNTVDNEIKKINENSDIINTENMIHNLRDRINARSQENNLINYEPPCSEEDMNDLLITLDSCRDILETTYEFGKQPIEKAVEHILSGVSIDSYIADNRNKSNKNKLQEKCEYVFNYFTKKNGLHNVKCTDTTCPALKFYQEISDISSEVPDIVIEDETFITCTKLAYQNIRTVINKIQAHKSILEKLPNNIKEMFVLKTMMKEITSLKPLCDKSKLYAEMSMITDYGVQQSDLNELKELKERLKLMKNAIGSADYFIEKKESLLNSIDTMNSDIENMKESIKEMSLSLSDKESYLVELNELLTSIETKEGVESSLKALVDSYEALKELHTKKKEITIELDSATYSFNKLQNEYNNNEYRLQSFEELSKELSKYRVIYDEMELVKKSLSSKEGIPLFYQQVYLKDIQCIANELLDIIYDGELYIEKFEPSADDFKIPFVTKNSQIGDVSYASQGERSFISLALSFALIYQSISKYNVVLLDEIDSTLDTRNREKFIQILEKQLEMINGDQIFLISHNNMFSMYPVDVIDTKNKNSQDNQLAHFIPIKIS